MFKTIVKFFNKIKILNSILTIKMLINYNKTIKETARLNKENKNQVIQLI